MREKLILVGAGAAVGAVVSVLAVRLTMPPAVAPPPVAGVIASAPAAPADPTPRPTVESARLPEMEAPIESALRDTPESRANTDPRYIAFRQAVRDAAPEIRKLEFEAQMQAITRLKRQYFGVGR